MSHYRSAFPKRHTLLIVVHAEDPAQAVRNARIARDQGADGVFLINHHIPAEELLAHHTLVREALPGLWTGLNFLDLSPTEAIAELPYTAGGIWTDHVEVDENAPHATVVAETFALSCRLRSHRLIHFGGVAFKYQRPVKDPAVAAVLAAPHTDVVTTSGAGTGMAADVAKIRAMKEALGDRPLAIASGITPENVAQYLPWADCFLVATGVSRSDTELDPARLAALVRAIESGH